MSAGRGKWGKAGDAGRSVGVDAAHATQSAVMFRNLKQKTTWPVDNAIVHVNTYTMGFESSTFLAPYHSFEHWRTPPTCAQQSGLIGTFFLFKLQFEGALKICTLIPHTDWRDLHFFSLGDKGRGTGRVIPQRLQPWKSIPALCLYR